MPSFTTADLPKPKSWEEFEEIVSDVAKMIWKDELVTRNGRLGQKQKGVDIYGKPAYLKGAYSGIQCKNSEISLKEVKEIIELADEFKPSLKELIIAITSDNDSKLQEEVRIIDEERVKTNKFSVRILFWGDLHLMLSENEELMNKHFPQFMNRTSSIERIKRKIMESKVDDWVISEDQKTYTYKSDTNLFLQAESSELLETFGEPWAKGFPDPNAYPDHYLVFYGNSKIDKLWAVSVDGGRCTIPYPKNANNLTITRYQYKLGEIINGLIYGRTKRFNTFDDFLTRAKIKTLDN